MNPLARMRWIAVMALMGGSTAVLGADLSGTWISDSPVSAFKTTAGTLPPLNPTALALYQSHLAAAKRGDRSWDPVTKCKPPGEPRTMVEMGWPFELMQSSHRVDFLFQWNRLDRAIPIIDKQPDFQGPYYFGQSIAHWDGDTLVVEVMGEKSNTFLDPAGLPHGDDMVLTERFRTLDNGQRLEARIHVVDTATYTQPWDTVLTFKRAAAGTRIKEDVCIERLGLTDYSTIANTTK